MSDPSGPQLRRPILINAARNSFRTAAYDDVGLREIGAAANLDVGQIVREFGSKEDLFASVLSDAMAEVPIESARWSKRVAEELSRASGPHTEPFRLIAFSGTSPKLANLIRAEAPVAMGKLASSLEPGEGLNLRANIAGALIIGQTICREMLGLGPSSSAETRLAKQFLSEALETLRSAPQVADPRGRPSGASETRAAILAAAKVEFSRLGYDHGTVRGIAKAAGTDPALVIRYFYSKENLFYETLMAFSQSPEKRIGSVMLVDWMVLSALVGDSSTDVNPLVMTLRSASSPVAREILGGDLVTRFHEPLAKVLGGAHAELRVTLMLSLVAGILFSRSIIGLTPLPSSAGQEVGYLRAVFHSLAGN